MLVSSQKRLAFPETTWGNAFELNKKRTGNKAISGTQKLFPLSLPSTPRCANFLCKCTTFCANVQLSKCTTFCANVQLWCTNQKVSYVELVTQKRSEYQMSPEEKNMLDTKWSHFQMTFKIWMPDHLKWKQMAVVDAKSTPLLFLRPTFSWHFNLIVGPMM